APLRGERPSIGGGDGSAKVGLAAGDRAQLAGEQRVALGQRRLEPACGGRRHAQRLIEALRTVNDPLEPRRVGATHAAQMRNGCERRRGDAGAVAGILHVLGSGGRAADELLDFALQLAPARVELEQHRLGRLAREPELAALRIPADAVLGHGRHARGEQLRARDDRQVDEVARVAADEHEHGAEAGGARLVDELEAALRVLREHGRGAMAERRGGRALAAGFDLEQLQRELLALLGERTRRRGQALALGERLLERRQPLACEAHARLEILVLAHRGPCRGIRLVGGAAELGRRRAARCATHLFELVARFGEQPLRRLVAYAETLRRAAQGEQRIARAAGERRLGVGAPGENRVELRRELGLRTALDRGDARPALLRLDLQPRALARRRLRCRSRVARRALQLRRRARPVRPRRLELGAQRRGERRGCLAAERQALAAAAQPVERCRCALALAGRVRQLFFCALALGDERSDLLVERAPFVGGRRTARLGLRAPLGEARKIECRDRSLQLPDLDRELLRALGGRRLQRDRPQPLLHLCFDVAGAFDLHLDARELQLRTVTAPLEAAEPGRLLDQLAAL